MEATEMTQFYGTLADWWPVLSPVEDYAEEAADLLDVMRRHHPTAKTLLELGSGGGHVAYYLAPQLRCCLTDISTEMVEVSRRLNPGCEHVVGDMRTLALGRTFDIVLAHDAVEYMTTETALAQAIATAWRHLEPGGIAFFVPDTIAEQFAPGADVGGGDAPDGRAARLLEWTDRLEPGSTEVAVHYAFILREADGRTTTVSETHQCGVFPEATWHRLFEAQGFALSVVSEQTTDDRVPRSYFVGRRPPV
jgi:SAM-dependent methyltransferase